MSQEAKRTSWKIKSTSWEIRSTGWEIKHELGVEAIKRRVQNTKFYELQQILPSFPLC